MPLEVSEDLLRAIVNKDKALSDGRTLAKKGAFKNLRRLDDNTLLWGQCQGSGAKPYELSIDLVGDTPTIRCSCPVKPPPCKHTLGLLVAYLEKADQFKVGDGPAELLEKRSKNVVRAEKKADAATKPKEVNRAALEKKTRAQQASDLLTWQYAKVGNSCLLAPPSNIARDWDLVKGVPRAANFQPDARCSMDPGFPKLVGLTDNMRNPSSLIIASRRLQECLAAKVLKNVEFLPISIVNHKGRVASADYFIVHPVYPQDCLDVDASGCEYNLLIKTYIDAVKRIVIAFNRLDPDVSVFRVKNFRSLILVRRTLAAELVAAGFSGLRFGELQDYRD